MGVGVEFDESVRIARAPTDVFAMLVDVQEWATPPGSPIVAMEKIPPGDTTVGTRWREVVRLGRRRTMTMWSEVTAIEPERLLAARFWGGSMRGTLTYTIRPDNGDAVLRQQESLTAVGWLRPFGWLVGRILTPRLHERLLHIRDELEARGRTDR